MKVREIKNQHIKSLVPLALKNSLHIKAARKAASKVYKEIKGFDPVATMDALGVISGTPDADLAILGLAVSTGHYKRSVLDAMGDTQLTNLLPRYLEIAQSVGFEIAMKVPFTTASSGSEEPRAETMYIMAHRKYGIVLVFDTYTTSVDNYTPHVNSGQFYYCWVPHERDSSHRFTSTGGWYSTKEPNWLKNRKHNDAVPSDLFWHGNHDCREALRFNIEQLAKHGNFLPVWPDGIGINNMHLLHRVDWKAVAESSYTSGMSANITRERYKQLPDRVKAIINHKEEVEA